MSDTPKAAGELPTPILLGEGLSLVDIWQSLHASERTWGARSSSAPRFAFEDMVWGSDRMLMELLTEVPAQRWITLCYGAGFTNLGAAALSWCREAMLSNVLHIFRLVRSPRERPMPPSSSSPFFPVAAC